MSAQNYRHRITVQKKGDVTDPDTGYTTPAWIDRVTNEPAAWLAGPGREYLASESLRAAVTGRFKIRWSPEAVLITAGDRVLWDGRVFSLQAPPMPDETARRELVLMVSEDGSDS